MFFGCKKGVPPAPPKPDAVATEAIWVPGGTGGVWIACKATPDRDNCTVWGESGRVWATGAYRLSRELRPAPQSALVGYLAYDGDRIFLSNGDSLTKFEP
jgi:hypothetical protein